MVYKWLYMVHKWSHDGFIMVYKRSRNGLTEAYKLLYMVHKWFQNGIRMVYKGLYMIQQLFYIVS